MKITDMMLTDIRAEIQYGEETIIIRNAKGDVRLNLLNKLNEKLENKTGLEDMVLDDLELIGMLIKELTNIEVDDDVNVREILLCPNEELNRVSLILASILQELMFEVMATHNLIARNQEFALLQNDTMACLSRVESTIDEVRQRSYIRTLNEEESDYNFEPKTNVITESITSDDKIVPNNGEDNVEDI